MQYQISITTRVLFDNILQICNSLLTHICTHGECLLVMMTSSNGNMFRVTGLLCGEFTGHRWIPHIKASDAELWCFFLSAWINSWVNNSEAGDLRRHSAHYDVTVMSDWTAGWSAHQWHHIKLVLRNSSNGTIFSKFLSLMKHIYP